MKTSQILINRYYTNGNGQIRKVVAEGSDYASHTGQFDHDCVRYEVVEGPQKGRQGNTTRRSFARWAKSECGVGNEGFSLLELAVVIAVAGIILAGVLTVYPQFARISVRQQRLNQVEREINYIHLKLSQSIPTLTGQELGFYSGLNYSVASMPTNGSVINNKNKTAIQLGLITPYKVQGSDAFTIIYGRHTLPRMELVEPVNIAGNSGVALVAVPELSESTNDPNAAAAIVSKFKAGDLMMIAGGAPAQNVPGSLATSQAVGRIVRLVAVPRVVQAGNPVRNLLEFTFDACEGPCSGQAPGLQNNSQKSFAVGSAFVGVNFLSFYLSQRNGNSYVIKSDGGLITPDSNGAYQVLGGFESILGEADSFTVSYQLADGSVQPTPANPTVPWLNQIVAVNVEITRSMPSTYRGEQISRTLNFSYPVRVAALN